MLAAGIAFRALGDADNGNILDAEFAGDIAGNAELAGTSVDKDEIRPIGKGIHRPRSSPSSSVAAFASSSAPEVAFVISSAGSTPNAIASAPRSVIDGGAGSAMREWSPSEVGGTGGNVFRSGGVACLIDRDSCLCGNLIVVQCQAL